MHGTREIPPDVAVVEAIAAKEDIDETDLPPIADVINPDALNTLFDSIEEAQRSDAHVQFEYCEYTVHIRGDLETAIE